MNIKSFMQTFTHVIMSMLLSIREREPAAPRGLRRAARLLFNIESARRLLNPNALLPALRSPLSDVKPILASR